MILGAYNTLPNPVQIQVAPFSVVAGNVAMGGVKMQRLIRCWTTSVFPANQTIRGYRFRLVWQDLAQSDMEQLRLAHQAAVVSYVLLSAKDLGVSFNGQADQYYVIVDPKNQNLNVTWQQGYAPYGSTYEGPVVYNAEASFIGATYWIP